MQLAALGLIGQIVQTSSTIGEALTNACSFVHLITDMFELKVVHSEKDFRVNFLINEDKAAQYPFTFRHTADYLMVFVVHELNGLLLLKVVPLTARFPYALSDLSEYERLFACRIPSKSKELSLQFSKSILTQPILSANYELQNHLLKQVDALKKNQGEGQNIHIKIYNYLLTNSYLHALSLDDVAANFNLSARSLQRKLSDEGVTYFEIVEEVRKKLATTYLSSAQYSVKDISNILGYQEQSAFVRAFKRWTNKTPGEFQKGRAD
jgi:AraC-like DNA-binding protein